MREILFRAKILETEFQNVQCSWGRKNGDWVEGFYYVRTECVCGGYEYCECDGFDQHLISVEGEDEYPIDPDTVGQYTGLTDKNGKKIFEGDILKIESTVKGEPIEAKYGIYEQCKRIDYAVVQEDEKTGGYKLKVYHNGRYKRIAKFDVAHIYFYYKAEVIGNIHDNPELLEVP